MTDHRALSAAAFLLLDALPAGVPTTVTSASVTDASGNSGAA